MQESTYSRHNHTASTKMALSATLHCLIGCAIGKMIGVTIGTHAGFSPHHTVVYWLGRILSLTAAFIVAYPVNVYLLKCGKGHAITHQYHY